MGIEEWFEEVRKACSRVETIAKRKSGAEDIALERRLRLFPRTHVLVVEVQRFILGQPKGAAPYEGPAEAVAKAAAESGESDGDGEMLGENGMCHAIIGIDYLVAEDIHPVPSYSGLAGVRRRGR